MKFVLIFTKVFKGTSHFLHIIWVGVLFSLSLRGNIVFSLEQLIYLAIRSYHLARYLKILWIYRKNIFEVLFEFVNLLVLGRKAQTKIRHSIPIAQSFLLALNLQIVWKLHLFLTLLSFILSTYWDFNSFSLSTFIYISISH